MTRSAVILISALILYWFALSGYFDKTILLVTGGLSVLFTVFMMKRMKILDGETVPYANGKALSYWLWLFKQIVEANMEVVKAVLSPRMEISPTMVDVPMHEGTDLGRTVFANSITLTPGTVSVSLYPDHILVHALMADLADPQSFKEMELRSGWAVSDPMGEPQKRQNSKAKRLKSPKSKG